MIELFDGWKIEVDSMAYTLVKEKTHLAETGKRAGEMVTDRDIRGYYATMEGALNALGKEIVRDNLKDGSHSLTEALNVVRDARETIENLLKEKIGI